MPALAPQKGIADELWSMIGAPASDTNLLDGFTEEELEQLEQNTGSKMATEKYQQQEIE